MSDAETNTPAIALRFINKREFLGRFLPDIGIGGFLWASEARELGERLVFHISFVGYGKRFILTGHVVWRQSKPPSRPDLPKGVGIEFEPEVKEELHELLLFAGSEHEPEDTLKARDDREESRLRVVLNCEYLYNEKLIREKVSNISPKGLYVETTNVLAAGTEFVFYLVDEPLIRPLVMSGKVIWNTPEAAGGFGVELSFDSRKHKNEYRQYVETLSEKLEED